MTYQRDDSFAIGVGLEVVGVLKVLADEAMVVDLAIDSEDDGVISVGQGLSAGLYERNIRDTRGFNTIETYTNRRRQCSDAHGRELIR